MVCYGHLVGSAAAFLLLIPGILAWGKEGHYAICKIAEGLFSKDTAAAVQMLLPESAEGDLASLCSWADEIKRHLHWSSPLHYVDTPDFRCNYEYCRDCHDSRGHKDRCVTGAIYNYSMQLMDYQKPVSEYNLTEALLFLSHFIGDVHQPLHVGFIGDLGGNTITVRWYRRKTNLHHKITLIHKRKPKQSITVNDPDIYIPLNSLYKIGGDEIRVWDTMIIDSALQKFYNSDLLIMIQAIQRNISEDWSSSIQSWENCASNHTVCPDPYASESVKLACKYAYRNATPGSTLTDDYFLTRLPIVERRLAQGGIRLAASLNRIFASKQLTAQA